MKNFLLLITFIVLLLAQLHAQHADSVKVSGLDFKFLNYDRWKELSRDSGICIYSGANLTFDLPSPEPTCGGEISLQISYVTDKEREERKSDSRLNLSEDILSQNTWTPKYGSYDVLAGSLETTSPRVSDIEGETKKEKRARIKRLQENPIHNYSTWFYFPINDTLEIVISYIGRIPHREEAQVDNKLGFFVQYFFESNSKPIDSLLLITDPYRFEPKQLPLDSVIFMKSVFRYPILPGWKYDTTSVANELKTNFMKIQSVNQSPCNHASITLNYRKGVKDKKPGIEDLKLLSQYALLSHFGFKPPQLDTSQMRRNRDSSFVAQEQHYYFTQLSSIDQNTQCTTSTISETICVIIYPNPNERIRITINFECVAQDHITQRDYIHAYYRFVILMAENNDFEQFYLNNKQN